ncbi:hypothetical protein [Komagataeibacter saccharivorans]|uniref:hypothetical protein n=1 Tax=Komagataeibacter saccharivorans TaxID=265959 RepID=UPI000C842969|nr:hypothetical protein [Komagataeibacter saccharivorans]
MKDLMMRCLLSLAVLAVVATAATMWTPANAADPVSKLLSTSTTSDDNLVSISEMNPIARWGATDFSIVADSRDVSIENDTKSADAHDAAAPVLIGETTVYNASPLPGGRVLVKVRNETTRLTRLVPIKEDGRNIRKPVLRHARYETALILARRQKKAVDVPVVGGQVATIIMSRSE